MLPYILNDRSLLSIEGSEAPSFLQRVITTDITQLTTKIIRPGALLSPQGKILFDFLIFQQKKDQFFLDCQTKSIDDLSNRLKLYSLRSQVKIEKCTTQKIAILENKSIPPAYRELEAYKDERFKDIFVWRLYGHIVNPMSLSSNFDSWLYLRIKYGIAEIGSDFTKGEFFPHDVGLHQQQGIGLNKGCYIGQEIVSRMHHRGAIRKAVFLLKSEDFLPPSGTEICLNEKPVGKIGSVFQRCGLSILRIETIQDAYKKGDELTANGIILNALAPKSFSFEPENKN